MEPVEHSKKQLSIQEEVRHIEELLNVHRKNLRELELRAARKGIDVDIKTRNEIEHEKGAIAQLEQRLSGLPSVGRASIVVSVDDHPSVIQRAFRKSREAGDW